MCDSLNKGVICETPLARGVACAPDLEEGVEEDEFFRERGVCRVVFCCERDVHPTSLRSYGCVCGGGREVVCVRGRG